LTNTMIKLYIIYDDASKYADSEAQEWRNI
jgi:hypothetical protein